MMMDGVAESGTEYRILGPVEAVIAGRRVAIKGNTALTLLAGLLYSSGQVVSWERLVDWVWAADLPEHPRAALHNAVARLRRALGTASIETTDWGYRFQVDPFELDLLRFDHLTALAAHLESGGRTAEAIAALDEALALWRTPLLGNVESATLRRAVVPRLVDRYLATVEARAALCLRMGRHDGLADELAEVVRQHPFREALVGWLMIGLVRTGRQAEALAAYEALARSLAEELGIAPLGPLTGLRDRILRGEPVSGPVPLGVLLGPEDGAGRPAKPGPRAGTRVGAPNPRGDGT
jgi:DNA-binding SARP family transcriptional activator